MIKSIRPRRIDKRGADTPIGRGVVHRRPRRGDDEPPRNARHGNHLQQPTVGLLAGASIIAVSLAVISLFSWPAFSGWVTYALICSTPSAIVVGTVWQPTSPAMQQLVQPARGLALLAAAAAVGAASAGVGLLVVGRGMSPPIPALRQFAVLSIPVTFWVSIVWQGWPFARLTTRVRVAACLIVACYAVNYALFEVMVKTGWSTGPIVDAVAVSSVAVMFLMLQFDLWPLTRLRVMDSQPARGAVWTITVLVAGVILVLIATARFKTPAMVYMSRVPIPFIFGSILTLNTFQGSLVARLAQPLRGVCGSLLAAGGGFVLGVVYRALAPTLTGRLTSVPPTYERATWLASALLGVTFLFLSLYKDFFGFWPLWESERKSGASIRDTHRMELRQLEYFVAVAEERSFTRAAQRLHLVQSGVSATIKSLEAELGIQLLDRTSKRVELTDAGSELLANAREVLRAARHAVDAVDAVRGGLTGHVRIGTITARGFVDLPALLGDFHKEHPAVRFTLTVAARGSAELAEAVAASSLDLAIASLPDGPPARVVERELGSSPMALVVAAGHRLAAEQSVRLTALDGETFVDFPQGYGSRRVVDDAFRTARLHREVALEIADTATGADFVAHDLGVAILPRFAVPDHPRVRVLELREPGLRWPLSVVTSARQSPGAAARALLDTVADYIVGADR